MTLCLDIHTHHLPPQPLGVIAVTPADFHPIPGQYYSLGIHPWDTEREISKKEWDLFDEIAAHPAIVAIGECGLDKLRGGPLFRQMLVMKHQIEISEQLGKPLVIHDVKYHDVIVGLKRDLKPRQKWLVHGFRGKPSLARMMTDVGIYLSFGDRFNPDTLRSVPSERILAETDESPLSIQDVIGKLSADFGEDITALIAANTRDFLGLQNEN